MYSKQEILINNQEYIVEQYRNPDITQKEIAEKLGVSPSTLNRFANKLNLTKVLKTVWSSDKIEWLKSNYLLPYKTLEEHLGLNEETIRLKLEELGIKRNNRYRPFKVDMSDTEFLKDLDNPRLSAPDIVNKYKEKYGVGESRIHQLRKKRGIKLQIDTLARESSLETEIKKILEKIDLAYIKEKRIGKYSIDFYLGFKICIEVQSNYWHSKPRRIESDRRKKEFLESQGYKLLYIWEDEMSNAEECIRDYVKKQGLPIQ